MNKQSSILITGAAGFIASVLAVALNKIGFTQLYLSDDFDRIDKMNNHHSVECIKKINRVFLMDFLESGRITPDFIIHLGARTDTTEMNYAIHKKLNLDYSIALCQYAIRKDIPFLYASSAATYGLGEHGYNDDHESPFLLQPLNPYGVSKNEFDQWILRQEQQPTHWYGLKFFNVFGPNEYHKGRMASVVFHAYHQLKQQGFVKLFRSHHPQYKDGEQQRDFIYVYDIVQIIQWLLEHKPNSGLYNAGTGKASTFNQLAHALFEALDMEPKIEYIDTPIDIRDKYQYFTEASMQKLLAAGYDIPFTSLQDAVRQYVLEFLEQNRYFS